MRYIQFNRWLVILLLGVGSQGTENNKQVTKSLFPILKGKREIKITRQLEPLKCLLLMPKNFSIF